MHSEDLNRRVSMLDENLGSIMAKSVRSPIYQTENMQSCIYRDDNPKQPNSMVKSRVK